MKKLLIILVLLFSATTVFGQDKFVRNYNYTVAFTPDEKERSGWQNVKMEFYGMSGDLAITKEGLNKIYFVQTGQVSESTTNSGIGYQKVEFTKIDTRESIICILYDTGEAAIVTKNGGLLFQNR